MFTFWRKKIEISDTKFLFLTSELIANVLPSIETEAQFPKYIDYENIRYLLEYKFEPGHSDDGLSIKIPLAVLHQTPKYLFDWLVPGMLVDKCIEMIKSLPKSTRKQFVPIPESVKSIAHMLKAENKPLGQQLGKYLFAVSGQKVHEDLWDIKKINPWYRASFKLIDENNQIFHAGTNLDKDKIVTNGGRVLSVVSSSKTMNEALIKSYKNIDKIDFKGKVFRKDIGFDL